MGTPELQKRSKGFMARKEKGRSEKEMMKNISTHTKAENVWADIVVIEIRDLGIPADSEDHGIDCSGKIIYDAPIKEFKKQDKKLIIDGMEFLTEFKESFPGRKDFYEVPYMTVKLHDITTCINTTTDGIKNGRLIICDEKFWMWIRPKCAKKLLDLKKYLKEKGYKNFEDFGKGNYKNFADGKDAVRFPGFYIRSHEGSIVIGRKLYEEQGYEEKIEIRRWGGKAQKLIKKYENILFHLKEKK